MLSYRKHPLLFATAVAIAVLVVLFVGSFFAPYYGEICNKNQYTGQRECSTYHIALVWLGQVGESLNYYGVAISAVSTFVIAIFTGTLWVATTRQGELTEQTLVISRRSFVFPKNISPRWEIVGIPQNTAYNWRFVPIWENSGDTPTKDIIYYVDSEFINVPIPSGFNFNKLRYTPGTGLLAPKTQAPAGIAPHPTLAPLSPQDVKDIIDRKKFLYIWGWVSYYDVFPGSKEHITRFCWQIAPVGDPFSYIPAKPGQSESLRFDIILNKEGNCADDECTMPLPPKS
jgi:hypothetical protein